MLKQRGEPKEARSEAQKAERLYRSQGEVGCAMLARTMGQIADIHQAQGQLDEALRNYQKNIPIREKLGDVRGRAVTRGKIDDILAAKGRLDETIAVYEREVFPAHWQLGDQQMMAIDATHLGWHYLRRGAPGDLERARKRLQSVVQPQAVAMRLTVAAVITQMLDELDRATSRPPNSKKQTKPWQPARSAAVAPPARDKHAPSWPSQLSTLFPAFPSLTAAQGKISADSRRGLSSRWIRPD